MINIKNIIKNVTIIRIVNYLHIKKEKIEV